MILIADDDVFYVEQLTEILTHDGCSEIRHASTGEQALTVASAEANLEILVLDMMIPYDELDSSGAVPPSIGEEARGLRVARELISMGFPNSRIVVITALWDFATIDALHGLGIRNVFIKPVETTDILRVLRALRR